MERIIITKVARRILLLSLVFPPDAVSTAQLFGEVVEDLVLQERSVTVITTTPHYNASSSAQGLLSPHPVWKQFVMRSRFKGAYVYHVRMPMKSASFTKRIAAWMGFHIMSIIVALGIGPVDVILTPSPPLTIGLAAWLISRIKRAPFIYNVQEMYPDTAVALGILRKGALLSILQRIERFIYQHAFAVAVIAEGMRRHIVAKGTPSSKTRFIPNFVDTDEIQPQKKDNDFSREFSLVEDFVVMYAGNMGPAQQLEILLDAAELTRDVPTIKYVFVGDGVVRDSLADTVRSKSLQNVLFVPQQPYSRVPEIYATADLCVVPLASSLAFDAVPSKVYRIMAAARPILAITAEQSDLAMIVNEARSGVVVSPDNRTNVADVIRQLYEKRDPEAGLRGRAYTLGHVARHSVTDRYGALLDEAVRISRSESRPKKHQVQTTS